MLGLKLVKGATGKLVYHHAQVINHHFLPHIHPHVLQQQNSHSMGTFLINASASKAGGGDVAYTKESFSPRRFTGIKA